MRTLPEPLRPLESHTQFILYKLVKRDGGKTDKLPVDHRTLKMFESGANWQQDPAAWTTHSNAAFLAGQLGPSHGVGFFFTPQDPFFFLDIDNCLVNGDWSPTAKDIMARLPGVAIEVSQSGSGLHLFGTYSGTAPEHSCKNTPLNLELYTQGRFVALTGDRAVGSASTDCTASLVPVIDTYYTPKAHVAAAEWTSEPVPEYTGPEDDTALIEKASAVKSAAAAFSGSSNFAALWAADEDALAVSYPDQGGRAYDASSADAALAQHLAFWTGKNCDRMLRLMKASALVRDKWDYHGDYLERTILRAVSLQENVYSVGGTPADTEGLPKLRGKSERQIDFGLTARAEKLAECVGDEEGTALLLKQRDAKFWIESRDKTAQELIKSLTPVETVVSPFENIDAPEFLAGYQFLGAEQQVGLFGKCTYIQDSHRIFTPSGALLKSEQFNATYGGYMFQLDDSGSKMTKKAFEAFTESQLVRYPKAETMCFRPDLAPGELVRQDGRVMVNIYVPVTTKRKKGDVGPFLNHLKKVLPNPQDRKILLSYMAACVQHKGVKFQWAPLIQGVEGNGKTFFTRCVAAAIGEKYVHLPPASEISEKFNSWLFDKLFIGVEDIYVPDQKREIIEAIKPMITSTRLARRAMQQDQAMHDVCCNFIFNTNHRDGIRKTQNDRRFAIFYSAQQAAGDLVRDGMTGDYFPDLYQWLRGDGYAIVTDYLYSFQIPYNLNPAKHCHRAPETSTTAEAIVASMGGIEQEILEAIDECRPGFAGGWISSMALDLLLKVKRKDGSIPINKRKELLASLGYKWHEGLRDGRVNNPVMPDNGKPRLFIKEGHPDAVLRSGKLIAEAYQAAQINQSKAAEVFGNG